MNLIFGRCTKIKQYIFVLGHLSQPNIHYSLLIICEAYPLGLITHYSRAVNCSVLTD